MSLAPAGQSYVGERDGVIFRVFLRGESALVQLEDPAKGMKSEEVVKLPDSGSFTSVLSDGRWSEMVISITGDNRSTILLRGKLAGDGVTVNLERADLGRFLPLAAGVASFGVVGLGLILWSRSMAR